jgi:hypothetical protein
MPSETHPSVEPGTDSHSKMRDRLLRLVTSSAATIGLSPFEPTSAVLNGEAIVFSSESSQPEYETIVDNFVATHYDVLESDLGGIEKTIRYFAAKYNHNEKETEREARLAIHGEEKQRKLTIIEDTLHVTVQYVPESGMTVTVEPKPDTHDGKKWTTACRYLHEMDAPEASASST